MTTRKSGTLPVTLTFLGTRGEIDLRTRAHGRHSALLLSHRGTVLMLDCGADWLHRLAAMAPTAILVTHAHPDHAAGLADGAPCPVYATDAAWRSMSHYPVRIRHSITPRTSLRLNGVEVETFPVVHSLRAPAVGFRIRTGRTCLFYVPDVLKIPDWRDALSGIQLYIGDGAALYRSIVRGRGRVRIGHASVREQLRWCAAAGVPRAMFTHCGTEIVGGDGRRLNAALRRLAGEYGVEARFAVDGLKICLNGSSTAIADCI